MSHCGKRTVDLRKELPTNVAVNVQVEQDIVSKYQERPAEAIECRRSILIDRI